ncbi:MAG: hypothetical protein GX640_22780 [Fibrobacter sp.]|nr:hypothetical protein [Fibrobacter sp.]
MESQLRPATLNTLDMLQRARELYSIVTILKRLLARHFSKAEDVFE